MHIFKAMMLSLLLLGSTAFGKKVNGINIERRSYGYHVEFNIPHYTIIEVQANGQPYLSIDLPNQGREHEVGYPDIPFMVFNLIIGGGTQPRFANVETKKESVILEHDIIPAQPHWPKNKRLVDRPFVKNLDAYAGRDKPSSEFLKVCDTFVLRGVEGAAIKIRPFEYKPVARELIIVKQASFDVLMPQCLNKDAAVKNNASYSFNGLYDRVFADYNLVFCGAAGKALHKPAYSGEKYLIITNPAFESTMDGFVDWKEELGFDVTMVTTSTTGNTASQIKAYIQQCYNSYATRPVFVLLVGDCLNVETWQDGTTIFSNDPVPYSDHSYTLLDGSDYFPDVYIGRFAVTSQSALLNQIAKSRDAENQSLATNKRAVFMATGDATIYQGSQTCGDFVESTHEAVIPDFWNNGYTCQRRYFQYGASTQDVLGDINSNESKYLFYSGHGNTTLWSDYPLNFYMDKQTITNNFYNSAYPFVFSFACLTGRFYVSECFTEAWMNSEYGAAGCLGSMLQSDFYFDDILERRINDALFADFGDRRIGEAISYAKINFYQTAGSQETWRRSYLYSYNFLGDPSLQANVEYVPEYWWYEQPTVIDNTCYQSASSSIQTTENVSLIIESGADVNFQAGDNIILRKAFWAKDGCEFLAELGYVANPKPVKDAPEVNYSGVDNPFSVSVHPSPCVAAASFSVINMIQSVVEQSVKIRIYNANGKIVRELERKPAQGYGCDVIWDLRDSNNNKLPGGVYGYSCTYGAEVVSGSIIIVD